MKQTEGRHCFRFGPTRLAAALFGAMIFLGLIGTGASVLGAVITVDDPGDLNNCTLRKAIENANNLSPSPTPNIECAAGDDGPDVINFAATVTTVTLTNAAGGQLEITDGLTLTGPVTVTRNVADSDFRIFKVNGTGINVIFDEATVTQGRIPAAETDGGAGLLVQNGDVELNDCTFSYNLTRDGDASSGYKGLDGGAIAVITPGSLTMDSCEVSFNGTGAGAGGPSIGGDGGRGGGIYASGQLDILNSTIFYNTTGDGQDITGSLTGGKGGDGGGLFFESTSSTFSIENTIIDHNTTGGGGNSDTGIGGRGGNGAGIGTSSSGGSGLVGYSAVYDNVCGSGGSTSSTGAGGAGGSGGGIFFGGPVTFTLSLSNSTISGNVAGSGGNAPGGVGGDAGQGGGLVQNDTGAMYVSHSTITDNQLSFGGSGATSGGDGQGGGIYDAMYGTLVMGYTILAPNGNLPTTAIENGPDFLGQITSDGYNLIGIESSNHPCTPNTCDVVGDNTGNIFDQDPILEALAFNSPGFTPTHALLSPSPALDGGDPGFSTSGFDQRYSARPQPSGGIWDIGAYEAAQTTLSLTKTGDGDGTVTGSPDGLPQAVNCGPGCSSQAARYAQGTPNVTLSASSDAFSTFAGWTGACTGTGTCVVSMDSDQGVEAVFLRRYGLTLSVNPASGGSASGAGTYDSGSSVLIEASANSGWAFGGWTGDLVSTTNPETVIVDQDKSITANFKRVLTVSASPSQGGTVSGGGLFEDGATATVTATPASGWNFSQWTGDLSGSANPGQVVMNGPKTVVGEFVQEGSSYTVPIAGGTTTGAYVMVPVGVLNPSPFPATVFGLPVAGYDTTRMRIGRWNGTVYEEWPLLNQTPQARPGWSAWFIFRNDTTLTISGNALTLTTGPNNQPGIWMAVTSGWNQVGNPFDHAIPVDQIFLAGGATPEFWYWDGQGYWKVASGGNLGARWGVWTSASASDMLFFSKVAAVAGSSPEDGLVRPARGEEQPPLPPSSMDSSGGGISESGGGGGGCFLGILGQ